MHPGYFALQLDMAVSNVLARRLGFPDAIAQQRAGRESREE